MWVLNDVEVTSPPDGYLGFVYLITRKRDGKKYVGQKLFWSKVTKPPLKGKTKKRRSLKESDWKSYWSSCLELQKDVEAEGAEGFDRHILHLARSKAELNWLELKEQVLRDAIVRPDYYNGFVGKRITRQSLKKLYTGKPYD